MRLGVWETIVEILRTDVALLTAADELDGVKKENLSLREDIQSLRKDNQTLRNESQSLNKLNQVLSGENHVLRREILTLQGKNGNQIHGEVKQATEGLTMEEGDYTLNKKNLSINRKSHLVFPEWSPLIPRYSHSQMYAPFIMLTIMPAAV